MFPSSSLLSESSNIQVYHQISRIVLGEGSDVTLDSDIQQSVSAIAYAYLPCILLRIFLINYNLKNPKQTTTNPTKNPTSFWTEII